MTPKWGLTEQKQEKDFKPVTKEETVLGKQQDMEPTIQTTPDIVHTVEEQGTQNNSAGAKKRIKDYQST